MNRLINKRWQSLLLTTIATVIMLGTSPAFGQKSLNAKYPKPNFSAMEEYWEVVSYEYDFTGNGIPVFIVVAKKKDANAPRAWNVTWRDAAGVKVASEKPLWFDNNNTAKVGEPVRAEAYAPFKRVMPTVKTVVITEDENN
jgi:hypothetical protein